jgi:hypothetical protein
MLLQLMNLAKAANLAKMAMNTGDSILAHFEFRAHHDGIAADVPVRAEPARYRQAAP